MRIAGIVLLIIGLLGFISVISQVSGDFAESLFVGLILSLILLFGIQLLCTGIILVKIKKHIRSDSEDNTSDIL